MSTEAKFPNCKQCISYAICRTTLLESIEREIKIDYSPRTAIYFSLYSLIERCSYMDKYVTHRRALHMMGHIMDIDETKETFDIPQLKDLKK